jgi:hypothetical protein
MKIKLTEAVTADQIRQSMSGFVGPKFAKKASDEDIMKMVDLKDKIAKLQNTHILPIQKQIDALYKQYKIKSNKGIEESTSINEVQYKDAVAQFNSELEKHPAVIKAAKHYGKKPAEIVKALQMRLSTKGDRGGNTKEVSIDFKDTDSDISIKHKKKFESVNEGKKRYNVQYNVGKSKYVVNYHDGEKKHKDGSDFFDTTILKNKTDLDNKIKDLTSKGYVKESVNEITVTRISNFNLESDSYILMLELLKNNSKFKSIVSTQAEDLYSGGRPTNVFNVLRGHLSKIMTPQIILSVVQKINSKRMMLSIDTDDINRGIHNDRFAGILALGIIDSLTGDPIDMKLIKDLGNAKVAKLASEFSVNRGKQKLGAMLGNKGF